MTTPREEFEAYAVVQDDGHILFVWTNKESAESWVRDYAREYNNGSAKHRVVVLSAAIERAERAEKRHSDVLDMTQVAESALRAEVAALKADNEQLHAAVMNNKRERDAAYTQQDILRAERDALRAAASYVLEWDCKYGAACTCRECTMRAVLYHYNPQPKEPQ